jgi:hypothetical protein
MHGRPLADGRRAARRTRSACRHRMRTARWRGRNWSARDAESFGCDDVTTADSKSGTEVCGQDRRFGTTLSVANLAVRLRRGEGATGALRLTTGSPQRQHSAVHSVRLPTPSDCLRTAATARHREARWVLRREFPVQPTHEHGRDDDLGDRDRHLLQRPTHGRSARTLLPPRERRAERRRAQRIDTMHTRPRRGLWCVRNEVRTMAVSPFRIHSSA